MKKNTLWTDKLINEINRYVEFRQISYAELSRMAFGNPNKLKDHMNAKRTRFTLDEAVVLMAVMGLRPDRFIGWVGIEDLTVDEIVRSCKKQRSITKTVNALCRELRKENTND